MTAYEYPRKRPPVVDKIICSACLAEACAAGILMCEDARRAGIMFARGVGNRAGKPSSVRERIDRPGS